MKLAVVGSRNFRDYARLCAALDEFRKGNAVDGIISGGAQGADALARKYALSRCVALREILPDYIAHGSGAPIRRNAMIVAEADLIFAFWDGKSKGTSSVIRMAANEGKVCNVIRF